MITQSTNLNLIPGQVLPHINVSQYDYGSRTLEFKLFNGNQSFTLTSSMTAKISGTKADMHGFEYDATVDTTNQKIVADLNQQMTAAAGDVTCELIIKKSGERLGTCNFVIAVEKAALGDDTIISDTELPAIISEATAQMEAAAASASAAATSASNAATSETHAATSATTAANAATSATNSASSAATSAQEAEDSAERAAAYSVNVPYIGANGNWWVWNTTQGAYVDTGVDASITVDIEDITMLAPDATPYVTNTGTDTDPVFHLFIPKGDTGATGQTGPQGPAATIQVGTVQTGAAGSSATVTNSGTSSAAVFDFSIPQGIQGSTGPTGNGIVSIDKTGTSGLVDTYTVNYTDGNSDTFTVTNGRDGTGSGDMSKADYDPSDAVYNVGGIPAYVTAQIEGLDVSDSVVAGEYVTAVSESDGKISVTREAADITPTNGSSKMITSGGAYTALADKANTADLAAVATSGAYSDLSGTPSLATVATSGAYSDLSGTPTLATVATSGSYNDLSNKPTLGTAAAKNSTNAVTSGSTDLVESGAVYSSIQTVADKVSDSGDAYSSARAYSVGEYCIYNNVLYKCITNCSAGSWSVNASCFTPKTLTNAVSDINSEIRSFKDVHGAYLIGVGESKVLADNNLSSKYLTVVFGTSATGEGYNRGIIIIPKMTKDAWYPLVILNGSEVARVRVGYDATTNTFTYLAINKSAAGTIYVIDIHD